VSTQIKLMKMNVEVDARGAERLLRRHPWVFLGQVRKGPDFPGFVSVSHRGRFLALALWNPRANLALRAFAWEEGDPWERFLANLERALEARAEDRRARPEGGRRLVHAEGDFLPGLIVDEYAGHLVVQTNVAALEDRREALLEALLGRLSPQGVLFKNDSRGRLQEGLPRYVELAYGEVPEEIWIREGSVWLLARPYTGQKTGAFLDQRENRVYAGSLAERLRPRRALDVFSYQGGFGLHLAPYAEEVLVVDSSAEALAAARYAAEKNGFGNLRTLEANAFDFLKREARGGPAYDLVVLDPPSFARKKTDLERAYAAYKEINLRAMRLVTPGGYLLTASCSYHMKEELFYEMLKEAAGDARRAFRVVAKRGQAGDHPALLNVPETAYLKFAALLAVG